MSVPLGRFAGMILAGGQSTRMGQPKAWLDFLGQPMLARVASILRPIVDPLCVVAAPGQELPPLPASIPILRDTRPGLGPLQAVETGLRFLAPHAQAAYVSSCDVPLLRTAFVRYLLEQYRSGGVTVPWVDGFPHPLAGVYATSVTDAVSVLLDAGKRKLAALFEVVPTQYLSEDELRRIDPDLASLRNLNTPEEYAATLKRHTEQGEVGRSHVCDL